MAELPHFAQIRPQPGRRLAWVMAVVVHALLAAFLIYGIRWQTSAPAAVEVDLVRSLPAPVAQRPVIPPQEQKPVEPVPPKIEEEPEPPPPPKPAEILRKEPEKPKTVKKATQSIDAISKLLQHETDRLMNNRIADAANREQAQLKASQAATASSKGLMDYMAKVRGKIRGNIVLPPAIVGNPKSIFIVTQLPSGEVLSVKLKTSSGNPSLDAAVERAILKSSPLPKPDNPSLFERELSIEYRPLDDGIL